MLLSRLFASLFLAGLSACAAPADLTSLAVSTPITIDGDGAEWEGKTEYFRGEKISLGVQSDADALYVNWVIADLSLQRRILGDGVTLWIDPEGGDEEVFGIRFPLGLRTAGPEDPEADFSFADLPRELELITAGDTTRVSCGELGVDAAVRSVGGSVVYEARISLAADGFFATQTEVPLGDRLGLGVVATRPEEFAGRGGPGGRPGRSGPGGRGRPGGGGGGAPGGRGGPEGGGPAGRGGPQGPGGRMPELDVWITVALQE